MPAGATITNAWIQFTADETGSTTTNLTIRAEDIDNAPTSASTASNISTRTPTTASTSWSPAAWTSVEDAGAAQQTTNINAVIQEIVDCNAWTEGNALALIITGTGKRTAESYNGTPNAAPLLHIEYTQKVIVGSFTSSPTNPAPGEQVTFSWSVSHVDGGDVSCTLDVDNDGSADYTIPTCTSTPSQTHTYSSEGHHTARLAA